MRFTLEDNNIGASLNDLFVEEGFVEEEEDDSYEGEEVIVNAYMDRDGFVAEIAGAVGSIAGTAGKFAGTGKKGRASKEALAKEETNKSAIEAKNRMDILNKMSKDKERSDKAKNKRIWIWAGVGVILLIIGGLIYLGTRK